MNEQNYGIPDQQASLGALQQGVTANTALLQQVATAAIGALQTGAQQNAADLARAGNTLARSLTGKTTANNKALAQVGQQLSQGLQAQVAANTVALANGNVPVPGDGSSSGSTSAVAYYVLPRDDGSSLVSPAALGPTWGPDYKTLTFNSLQALLQWAGQGNPPRQLLYLAAGGTVETEPPQQPPQPTPPPPVPVPTPVTGGFGVYRDLATGKYFVTTPDTGAVPSSWGVQYDRHFDSYTAAYLYCRQRGCLDQPSGTTPPPPRPPPQAPAPSPVGDYYVYNYAGGPCLVIARASDSSRAFRGYNYPTLATDNIPPWQGPLSDEPVYGPYATEADALAALAAKGYDSATCPYAPGTPPTQPPPTQPPPTQPPPGTCPTCCCCPCQCTPTTTPPTNGQPLPPATIPPSPAPLPDVPVPTVGSIASCGLTAQGTLPAVGSPQFCACLDKLRDWAVNLGQQAIVYLFGDASGGSSGAKGLIDQAAAALLPLNNAPLIGSLKLGDRVQEIVNEVKPYLQVATQAVLTSPTCNPQAQVGIQLALSIVRILRQLRVGWTLGIQVTVDIDVFFPQLEAVLGYVAHWVCPTEIPSPPEVIEAYLRNVITEDYARCLLAMQGMDWTVFQPLIRARRDQLTTQEWIELIRRNDGDTATQVAALRNVGWLDPDEAAARVALYDELPTISDHLLWLQRNVFDDEYVKDFELMEGFEERFWAKFGKDLRTLGMLKSSAELHYAAHWLNPSPEQLKEMVYRLRPGDVPDNVAFSTGDYARVLQEKDISAYFRRRFQAIQFKVPALGYIRDQYRANVFDEARLKRYHQDLGYNPTDSENFVEIDRVQKVRFRAQQSHGWTPTALASAFSVGLVTEQFVRDRMKALAWTDEEATDLMARAKSDLRRSALSRSLSRSISAALQQIKQAQQAGVLARDNAATAIALLGYPEQQAGALADAADQEARVAMVTRATQRIRNAWHQGQVDDTFANAALAQLGIVAEVAQRMLRIWKLERTPNRRRRTALQYADDWANEELPEPEAHARLKNLGYEEEDIRLFFRAALRKVQKEAAKAAKGQEKKVAPVPAPGAGPIDITPPTVEIPPA